MTGLRIYSYATSHRRLNAGSSFDLDYWIVLIKDCSHFSDRDLCLNSDSSDDHRKDDMGAGGAITTMQVPNGTTPVPPSKRANGADEAKPGS